MRVTGSFRHPADAEPSVASIAGINTGLERSGPPQLMTEKTVERYWALALALKYDRPCAWLLLVRLAEAALLSAGNCADTGDFRTAGDFLVNPREIVVHSPGGRSAVKKRHGRLSEQFGRPWVDPLESTERFWAGVELETTRPPLLPAMTQTLKGSGRVAPAFIQRLEECQRRIADALAFVAAWGISDSAELWDRLRASTPAERRFAEACLCRFDARVFTRIGEDLRGSLADPDYRSSFLAGAQECVKNPAGPSPAAALELVAAQI
jgi:hypothetical protein